MEYNKVIHGDCLEVMPSIPDKSIDMILCDLPYGTTQCKWDTVIPFKPLWEQYVRLIRDGGVIVLTAQPPFDKILTCSNLEWFKYEWVWVKSKITGVLNAKKMPVRKHELILVFYSGRCTYNPQGLRLKGTKTKQGSSSKNYGKRKTEPYLQQFEGWPRDVLEFPSVGKTIHPTQKPVDMFEYLIKTYTNEGETVLDNCAGSGTTAIACIDTNRNYILIEKEKEYIDIINKRIAEHEQQIPLFKEGCECLIKG